MSIEAIKAIIEAEQAADNTISDAREAAARAALEAEAAGQAKLDVAAQKAKEEIDEVRRLAIDKARQGAKDLARNTENRKAAMLVKSENRKSKAIDFVIERIVRSR